MAASPAPVIQKNRPKKLLLLGFSASGSADFIEFFQPDEVLNKVHLENISWRDLLEIHADAVIMSGAALEELSTIPRPSALDDSKLSTRQREILSLVQKGFTNKQIAQATGLHPRAVKDEIAILFRFLEVANRTELAAVPAA